MIKSLPLDLFYFSAILLLCFLTGTNILRSSFRETDQPAAIQLLYSFAIGFGVISFLVFVLALAKLLTTTALVSMVIILIVISLRAFRDFSKNLKEAFRDFLSTIAGKFDYIVLSIFCIAVIGNFLFCYTPATQGKELDYHLTVGKLWLEAKGIGGKYDYAHKNLFYPFLVEAVYTLAIALRGEIVAKLIHYSFGIFSALFAYAFTKQFLMPRAALLAMTIVYLMPVITSESGVANSELASCFYSLLAIHSLFTLANKPTKHYFWIGMSGLMSGFSWQAKIVGISLVPTGFFFIALWTVFSLKDSVNGLIKKTALFSLWALIGCSPWLVKNLIYHDNPLYPVHVKVLGWQGHEYTEIEMESAKEVLKQTPFTEVLKMHNNIIIGDFLFGPGPLVFTFLLSAFLLFKTQNVKVGLFIGFLIFLFHSLLFNSIHFRFIETKYYLPLYCLLAILSAQGALQTIDIPGLRPFKWLIIGALIFPCLAINLYFGLTKVPVFIGLESKESYLRRKVPEYDLLQYANAHISEDATVLAIPVNPSTYYWKALLVSLPLRLVIKKDEEQLLKWIKETQITHLALKRGYLISAEMKDTSMEQIPATAAPLYWKIDDIAKKHFHEIFSTKDHILYKTASSN